MDLDAIFITALMVSFSTFGTALAFSAVGWWRSARRVRELEEKLDQSLEINAGREREEEVAARLESYEAQLERLADGQEFLTQVLKERPRLSDGGGKGGGEGTSVS
jgi:hypothetical protein